MVDVLRWCDVVSWKEVAVGLWVDWRRCGGMKRLSVWVVGGEVDDGCREHHSMLTMNNDGIWKGNGARRHRELLWRDDGGERRRRRDLKKMVVRRNLFGG